MKKLFLLIIFGLLNLVSFGQKSDSTLSYYSFYRGFSIHKTELKAKRGVLNGEYKIFNGKSVGVLGAYKNDERIGRWTFFYKKDTIEQVYNYSTKKLEYNRPNKNITYYLDSIKEGDTVVYPAKINASFGLYMLSRLFKPPYFIQKSIGEYTLYYVFTLNNEGRLIKYETKIASDNYNKIDEIDLKRLRPEDFDFSPAVVNGKNVASTMVIESKLLANIKRR
ncbi:MAG: hypothetical protein EOO45_00560 [Flavobacterium sp.]|nr:MAG: hypothetical protein EOO45_00560 [Flavobacterium sp.]